MIMTEKNMINKVYQGYRKKKQEYKTVGDKATQSSLRTWKRLLQRTENAYYAGREEVRLHGEDTLCIRHLPNGYIKIDRMKNGKIKETVHLLHYKEIGERWK